MSEGSDMQPVIELDGSAALAGIDEHWWLNLDTTLADTETRILTDRDTGDEDMSAWTA